MAAHAEISYVVEEDYPGGAIGVGGFAQESADDDVRAAGFVDDCGPEVVILALETLQAFGHGACSQIRTAVQDKPGRLACGVGVEDRDSAKVSNRLHLSMSTIMNTTLRI
jgi:hypothetical protein